MNDVTNRGETYWHPRTGTRYEFPKHLRRYLSLVDRTDQPCEYGHFGCAGWEDGPCSFAVESFYGENDER